MGETIAARKKDPYRKLEILQGEGPTLCVDCVHPRYENLSSIIHPKNLEPRYKQIAFAHPRTWRCTGLPIKEVDVVTGNTDFEALPRCKEQNDGECEWFAEYYEPKETTLVETAKKKPWWKFW